MNERFLKDAPRLFRAVDGWEFMVESSGAWVWSSESGERAIYATPFWEGTDGVLVQESDEYDNYTTDIVLPFVLTGDIATDADAYLDRVKPYLV